MRNRHINIIGIVLSLLCWSCNRPDAPDCIQSAGIAGVLEGELAPFSLLTLNDNLDYVLHIDSAWRYTIEGPVNLLGDIAFNAEGTSLEISNDNRCNIVRNKKRRISIHLYAPYFKNFKIHSQGTLKCQDTLHQSLYIQYDNANCNSEWWIKNDSTNIEYPNGTGDMVIKGNSETAWLYSNAIGKIDALDWVCQNLSVHHNSLQEMYAHPVNYLHAELHNKGNLWIPFYPIHRDKTETDQGKLLLLP